MFRTVRWLILIAFLAFVVRPIPAAPAAAQAQESSSPAYFVPADVAVYLEIRLDENLESDLQELVRLLVRLNGIPEEMAETQASQVSIDSIFQQNLPGITFNEDILPWIGDRIGVAAYAPPEPSSTMEGFAVLPIADAARAESFFDGLTANLSNVITVEDTTVFSFSSDDGTQQLVAVSPAVVWIGESESVEMAYMTRLRDGARLSTDPAFVQTQAVAPETSLLSGYFSGSWLGGELDRTLADSPDSDYYRGMAELIRDTILEAHPAESPMETALMESPALNGVGFAVDIADETLDVNAWASLDAQYAAPVLTTAGAGSALFGYLPEDAYIVLDSYDAVVGIGGTVGVIVVLALLGPAIGDVFEEIVEGLNASPSLATATPTPTPTPLPAEPELPAEVQPWVTAFRDFLRQPETLDMLDLLQGEYALAAFYSGDPRMPQAGALWIQTSDPAVLVERIDTGLVDLREQAASPDSAFYALLEPLGIFPPSGQSLESLQLQLEEVERREEQINGFDVTVWSFTDVDVLSYGVLAEDVAFLAFGSGADLVTDSARGDGVLTQANSYPADVIEGYGQGAELLFYGNLREAELAGMMGNLPTDVVRSVVVGADLQADGVLQFHLTLVRAD